jgi:hypothetical protein
MTLHWAVDSPATIARATSDGSEPSRMKPASASILRFAARRMVLPRCGHVPVWMRKGWQR